MDEVVFERLARVIVDQLSVGRDKVVPGASFVGNLGADSLDGVEFIMALEEEFGIEIPDEDAERILTVQSAYDYIMGKI